MVENYIKPFVIAECSPIGPRSKVGAGFIGLLACLVKAQQRARVYMTRPRHVPALSDTS